MVDTQKIGGKKREKMNWKQASLGCMSLPFFYIIFRFYAFVVSLLRSWVPRGYATTVCTPWRTCWWFLLPAFFFLYGHPHVHSWFDFADGSSLGCIALSWELFSLCHHALFSYFVWAPPPPPSPPPAAAACGFSLYIWFFEEGGWRGGCVVSLGFLTTPGQDVFVYPPLGRMDIVARYVMR